MEVRLKNLSKHFGKVKAVNNFNLKINDGEFVALLGPSGCGKTTTLLMIAGIYRPTTGDIYFGENIVNEVPPKDRKIGMVFQSYALYPHMTVLDNIVFPLKLGKTPRKERERRAKEVAKLVQIEELLDRKPAQLSGGQQQRVALCRALIKKPDILLLDEPLSNLDAKLRAMMRAELKRLQKRLGITTIFVTHDQVEAMTMSDKIALLELGKLQQYSSTDELYNRPESLFVAGFIGSPPMNIIDVFLEQSGEKYFLKNKDITIEIPLKISKLIQSRSQDNKIVLGIRPEDIKIDYKKGEEVEVYVIEPMGMQVLVTVKLGNLQIRVLTTPPFKKKMGEKVKLHFNLEKIHLFDKNTEKSLLLN
ncbi:MAG TPA: sugar ABC transporter ATP-binding protein [Candidatus Atribacteria bacterium]|jgi:ABC-type sugar transport system ATPase subunit|nr:sugar ABC transporter ATP-binding protein [Candidatus Atribacteria bacterium]